MRWIMLLALLWGGSASAQTGIPSWRLEEQLRIGSVSGPITFSSIADLTVSPDGQSLYVAQQQDGGVQQFDAATGDLIRTIGRSGEGPGEFRYLSNLGWIADTLYATDFLLDRVAMFSENGQHLRTTRTGITFQEEIGRPSYPIGLTSTGYFISQIRYTSDVLASGDVTSSPWSLVDHSGQLISGFATQNLTGTSGAAPIGTAVIYFVQPLSKRTYLSLRPDGSQIVVVDQPAGEDPPGTYRIARYDVRGNEVSTRTYRYSPQMVPQTFADSVHSTVVEHLQQLVPEGQAMSVARRYWRIPKHYPPITDVVVARSGDVWLRRNRGEEGSASWMVVAQDGRVQAHVAAPANLRILFVGEFAVWGVLKGEFDVEIVVKYRILT